MAGWTDIYKIDQNPDYVHNFKDNFQTIYEANIGKLGAEYNALSEAAKTVIVAIMDELIVDWDKFRRAFIARGNELGLSDKNDPEGFILQYNKYFKDSTSGKLTGDMLDLKQATFAYKQAAKSKTGSSKKAEIVQENWSKLIKFFIEALNFYEEQNKIWVVQLTGETEEQYKKRMNTKMPINLIVKEIKKALAPIGIKSDDDISSILNTLEKIQNGSISLDDETAEQIFINSYENQFAQATGKLIEFTIDVDMKSDEILNQFVDNQTDIRMPLSVMLKDVLVGDTLVATVKVDGKEIKFLSSMKLTDKVSVERPYNTITDILETRNIEFANKAISVDNSIYNKINWIRKNLISLNVLAYSRSISGEVTASSNSMDLKEFYAFEEDIALWNLIPRILDGIYEYQEEEIIKPQFQGNPVHTALFFTKGKFVWMVDILIGLRNLLSSGNIESGISKSSPSYFEPPIKPSDLESLYREKRQILQSLKNKKIKIDYLTIAKDLKALGQIDEIFKGWRPIKALKTVTKYSQFIK